MLMDKNPLSFLGVNNLLTCDRFKLSSIKIKHSCAKLMNLSILL
jgi:hypothetical protein